MSVDKPSMQQIPEEAMTAKPIFPKNKPREVSSKKSKEPSKEATTAVPILKSKKSEKEKKKQPKPSKEASREDTAAQATVTARTIEGSKDGNTKRLKFAKPDTVDHLNTARLLHEGDVLLKRFQVEGLLAGGGFAQVYLAKDLETGKKCAIKAQGGNEHVRRIKLEMLLYCELRGKKHIPTLLAVGPLPVEVGGMALILNLVGRSLADIRRQMPSKKLSPATLHRSMRQVLIAIAYIHQAGFLHRDVKPPNCCVDLEDNTVVYLLDFGLCRQFTDSSGMIRRPRKQADFRGTVRYASLAGHQKMEFGPCNDLIAFLYSTIELGCAGLPWSHIVDKDKIEKMKSETNNAQLCHGIPDLLGFTEYVMPMKFDMVPDYKHMMQLFDRCFPERTPLDHPFDWKIHQCDLDLKPKADCGNTTAPDVPPDVPPPRRRRQSVH